MVRYSGNSEPAAPAGRVPPYSEEAERGVLGSVLLDFERALNLAVENRITPDSFSVPRHRVIYDAMLKLQGQAIDQVTLTSFLTSHNQLESAGGSEYIQQLVDSTPTAAHAEYYIDIVRQKFLLREIIKCSQNAENACYSGERNADELLSQVEQDFLNITENQHGEIIEWRDAVNEVMEHVEAVFQNHSLDTALSTGFKNINAKVSGLRPAEMIVLAARPSMGKTSLAMNIAENVALGIGAPDKKPHAVGIFSLEMSYMSLVTRMLCCRAGVSGFKLAMGKVNHKETHAKLCASASELNKAPIYIDDTGGLDVMELRARARRMKKKYGIELIVIDYLQLLNCREYARQGRQLETSAISSNLKSMAKELNIPVLVLSQLSRAPEQRSGGDSRPKLSDLRDSGAIEQDADVVMMLRRPCRYPNSERSDDQTLAIVDIVKQRNGPTGEVELNFEEDYTRFRDRVHGVDGYENYDAPEE